jgi:hypothetical protein
VIGNPEKSEQNDGGEDAEDFQSQILMKKKRLFW